MSRQLLLNIVKRRVRSHKTKRWSAVFLLYRPHSTAWDGWWVHPLHHIIWVLIKATEGLHLELGLNVSSLLLLGFSRCLQDDYCMSDLSTCHHLGGRTMSTQPSHPTTSTAICSRAWALITRRGAAESHTLQVTRSEFSTDAWRAMSLLMHLTELLSFWKFLYVFSQNTAWGIILMNSIFMLH